LQRSTYTHGYQGTPPPSSSTSKSAPKSNISIISTNGYPSSSVPSSSVAAESASKNFASSSATTTTKLPQTAAPKPKEAETKDEEDGEEWEIKMRLERKRKSEEARKQLLQAQLQLKNPQKQTEEDSPTVFKRPKHMIVFEDDDDENEEEEVPLIPSLPRNTRRESSSFERAENRPSGQHDVGEKPFVSTTCACNLLIVSQPKAPYSNDMTFIILII
jgi:hypothetical protein